MITRVTLGTTGFACALLLCPTASPSQAHAAPAVLRSADARVAILSPTVCEVRLAVTVDGAAEIEHRLEVLEGAVVGDLTARGAEVTAVRTVGRTQAVHVRPQTAAYELSYRVEQPPAGRFRCPLWLPTTPADGRSRAVQLAVTLPVGAQPSGTMPAFTWRDGVGAATLGHLPAFVRVPYAADGVSAPWNLARLMDGVSVAVLVVASLLWLLRARRARGSGGDGR
jgi:hypothetical protein